MSRYTVKIRTPVPEAVHAGSRFWAPAAVLGALLVGCATAPDGKKDDSDVPVAADTGTEGAPAGLEKIAIERWQLLIAGKPAEAYAYLSSGYREANSLDDYIRMIQARRAVRWTSAKWMGADCSSASNCVVKIYMTYSIRIPQAGETSSIRVVQERWLKQDGRWAYLPDE